MTDTVQQKLMIMILCDFLMQITDEHWLKIMIFLCIISISSTIIYKVKIK